jgi:chromosome segregation ATPase
MAGLIIQLQSAHRTASEHLDTDQATQNTIAELEKRLAERDDALTRLHAQLEREAAEKRSAEELLFELNAVGEQAQKNLTLYEEAKRTFAKTQEQLENRLQGLLGNLSQVESKLKIEAANVAAPPSCWRNPNEGSKSKIKKRPLKPAGCRLLYRLRRWNVGGSRAN